MSWSLYLALKQLFPSKKFFSFFGLVSILGVMLGVMVLIIVLSVMNGFGQQFREKMVATNGDLRIETGQIIANWKPLIKQLEKNDQIHAITPYAHGVVMLQHDNIPVFPMIKGIDPVTEPKVLPIEEFLQGCTIDDLQDDTVLLSSSLAHQIGASKGSIVNIYTPLMLERMTRDEVLLPREVTVCGIYETGHSKVDGNTVICTLRLMQELYGMGKGIHGLTVKITPEAQLEAVSEHLNETLPYPLRSLTWLETNSDFLFILQVEKTMMLFIIAFIILVASFSIAITLMMSVIRKTREIGLLVSFGGQQWHIALSYCLQGIIIGVTGTFLGVCSAVVILNFRQPLIEAIIKITQHQNAFLVHYGFVEIPVHYELKDFIIIISFSIITSTLAGLIPAWKAAQMNPADALRAEG